MIFFKQKGPVAQGNATQLAIVIIAITGLAGCAYYLFAGSAQPSQGLVGTAQSAGLQLPRVPSLLAAGGHGGNDTAVAATTTEADHTGSLANTQLDGSWSIGPNGLPQPDLALRRRFDYFLLLQGEQDLGLVAARIRQQVQAAHGAAAAQHITALWDSYLRLQQHAWTTQVNPQRHETWSTALAERSAVRRQLLGSAWAEAFYGDEENALRQLVAHTNSSLAVAQSAQPSSPVQPAAALPDATERLAAHQAQWQQWEDRLGAARQHIARLSSAPELSGPQRSEAIASYINQHFTGSELLRVKALLNL